MEEFFEYVGTIWYYILFLPFIVGIIVELFKKYTYVTENFRANYFAWVVAVVLWAILAITGLVKIERLYLINIVVPGILIGMASNFYYDFICIVGRKE